jgi:hypothetical protein
MTPATGIRLSRALGLSDAGGATVQMNHDLEVDEEKHRDVLDAIERLFAWRLAPCNREPLSVSLAAVHRDSRRIVVVERRDRSGWGRSLHCIHRGRCVSYDRMRPPGASGQGLVIRARDTPRSAAEPGSRVRWSAPGCYSPP